MIGFVFPRANALGTTFDYQFLRGFVFQIPFTFTTFINPTYSKLLFFSARTLPIQERERRPLYSSHSTQGDRPSAALMKVVVHRYITRLHSLGVPVAKGCGNALFYYLKKWTTYQRQGDKILTSLFYSCHSFLSKF
ncbi:uncharacterized protein LOC100243910 isoform X2 [Vitis vinifera]|uniref:uncharacterized protein LOC100243910 isoform X2 n=1 Tax=Vitis vinifera TaxID=29760 RepID=UPI0008FEBB7D|nr:uncharacterized protein LOC100243910 isoform X2 [Vitis vinifera]|eukprot:XP_019079075.1 PREDICTED: uncharacterized protein LOC100243910 isoform X2 [Vitis vinifera]